jgi:hypothetical protein
MARRAGPQNLEMAVRDLLPATVAQSVIDITDVLAATSNEILA